MYTEVDDDVMLTRASHQSDMDVVRGSSSGGSFSRTITSPSNMLLQWLLNFPFLHKTFLLFLDDCAGPFFEAESIASDECNRTGPIGYLFEFIVEGFANTALTDFVKKSLINCLGCQAGGGNVRTEVKCMEGRINEFNQQNTIFSAPRQSKLPFIRLKFVFHKTQLIRANLLTFFLLGPDPPLYRRHHCSSLHHR